MKNQHDVPTTTMKNLKIGNWFSASCSAECEFTKRIAIADYREREETLENAEKSDDSVSSAFFSSGKIFDFVMLENTKLPVKRAFFTMILYLYTIKFLFLRKILPDVNRY